MVWQGAQPTNSPIDVDPVEAAHREMLSGRDSAEFVATLNTLASGGDPEVNEERAVFLLPEGGGATATTRQVVVSQRHTFPHV
jgi:hypothetical protein